ncbi:MAG TPA: hypothetical protein VJ768_06505 [Anaerolineales bacterium]|nr:hypothetical protein [Anaerolineales bacterium]
MELPIPAHFDPGRVGEVWRVPYEETALGASRWRQAHSIPPAAADDVRINLLLVDVQNTFCIPGFELFVGGRSGSGAVDDNRRLCEFIYRNLKRITRIGVTMDTHHAIQIFHSIFLVDREGNYPPPHTQVTAEDVRAGKWRFNPALTRSLGVSDGFGDALLHSYTEQLKTAGKYNLTTWPYHAILGGIGHALVSAVEEAVFFHTISRESQASTFLKGENTFTEHYSAVGPEIRTGPSGESLGSVNRELLEFVRECDALVIAGQAKSHCVAWTVSDLLDEIRPGDEGGAGKFYLIEDCTSPVVVPGVVDFTEAADDAFSRFAAAGVNVVESATPMETWPGLLSRRKENSG